jgi:hypothetical protein
LATAQSAILDFCAQLIDQFKGQAARFAFFWGGLRGVHRVSTHSSFYGDSDNLLVRQLIT